MKKHGKVFLLIMTVLCLLTAFEAGDIKAQARTEADFYRKEIDIVSPEATGGSFNLAPSLVTFFDYKGNYNVVSCSDDALYIYRYNKNLKLKASLKIKGVMEQFGNIVCDDSGNYYVCWAKFSDTNSKNFNLNRNTM